MRVSRQWEVKCPPAKKHMVAGKLVPTVKGVFQVVQKKRRVAIELHGPRKEEEIAPSKGKDLKSPVSPRRLFGRQGDSSLSSSRSIIDLSASLEDDDRIIIRILKPRKSWGFNRDPDDSSESEDEDNLSLEKCNDSVRNDNGWVEFRKFDLDEIEEEELNKSSWEATMGRGTGTERREIRFENEDQGK